MPSGMFPVRVVLLATAILTAAGAELPSDLVWQIGTRDASSAEFRPWIDPVSGTRFDYGNATNDFLFRVGRSEPGRDWPAYQPGTANGGAGYRAHPCAIEFLLANLDPYGYRLELSLLAYSARLPLMQVEVNGKVGWIFQEPQLDYEGGDAGVFFLPHYASSALSCDLPADLWIAGTNRIVLTAIDIPGDRDDTRPAGFAWPGSSGVHHDALRLIRLAAPPADPLSIRVRPSPFYVASNGRLREQVDVIIGGSFSGSGTVEFKVGEQLFTEVIRTERSFGEWRMTFLVDELAGPAEAEITVRSRGRVWVERRRLQPARKWTICVVPNVHLDVGYTDHPSKVAEIQSRILDRAVEWSEQEAAFRFVPDGFWCVEEFWNGRREPARQQLLQAMRRGAIALPSVYCSPFTGFASLENLIRLLYPSHQFAREHGVATDSALSTDVPNYSWSLASVLAASGIKTFVSASDAYRAPFLLYNRLHERSPHWWEGPDGGRVLTWSARHYHQWASLFGLPGSWLNGRDSLPRFLQAYDRPDYRSDAVILYGSQAENADLHPDQIRLFQDWNGRYAYPHLQFATFNQALDRVVGDGAGERPVVRGDGGPYWEDGLGANAATTALARRNMRRILSAEKAAALAALAASNVVADRRTFEQAWRNLLLTDEHTWQADCSVREPKSLQTVRQGAVKSGRATEAERQIDHVLGRALAALADQVQAPAGSILVFNSLSWPRSGWIELDLSRGYGLRDASTDERLPQVLLSSGNTIDRFRVYVRDVPAVGYRCLEPSKLPTVAGADSPIVDGVLENRFYHLVLDPHSGLVKQLRDKETGEELVPRDGTNTLNQYLYVAGGDEQPNRLVQYSPVSPLPCLTLHPAVHSRLVSARRTPFGLCARVEASSSNTPRIVTEWFLPAEEKWIDLTNTLTKLYTERKEAGYFVFPFQVAEPRFRYATQNGFVDPARDLLAGASREWFCLQDWLAVDGPRSSIALVLVDAPLITLGDIARGTWPRELGPRPATVYSYAFNNYTPEGYEPGQGGELAFRYRLTSARSLTPTALYRLGAEANTPLEFNEITRNDKALPGRGWLPDKQASLLQLEADHVALVTWKLAERGESTILRLLEMGGEEGPVRLRFPHHTVTQAHMCTALEDERTPLATASDGVQLSVRPFSINTLRLALTPKPLSASSP